MTYKPNMDLPTYVGGELFPRVTQPPPMVRYVIEANPTWFKAVGSAAQPIADKVVEANEGAISQFWNAQRHNAAVGGLEVVRTRLTLPQLDIQYDLNHGQEILTITAKPESIVTGGERYVDINYDGYITWVHAEPNWPDTISVNNLPHPNAPGPYDVYVNGYLVLKEIVITQKFMGIVIMFGPTALRCKSLQDGEDTGGAELNPLARQGNGGLATTISPPNTNKIQAMTFPDGDMTTEHDDLLGYYLFNWDDPNNQAFQVPTFNNNWTAVSLPSGNPTIVKGVQFASAASSPLKIKGVNNVSVTLSPLPTAVTEQEVVIQNVIYAEFYNRAKTRKVSRSWNYNVKDGTPSIVITDTPQQWCATSDSQFPSGIGARIDLTPNAPPGDDNLVTAGQEGNLGYGAYVGLTPAQLAANDDYTQMITAEVNAYYASLDAEITAQATTVKGLQKTYDTEVDDLVALERTLGDVLDRDGVQRTTEIASGQLTTGDPLYGTCVNLINTANLVPQGKEELLGALLSVAQAGSPLLDGLTALTALVGAPPPNLPPRPGGSGNSIEAFKYRTVDVIDGTWTFGAWNKA